MSKKGAIAVESRPLSHVLLPSGGEVLAPAVDSRQLELIPGLTITDAVPSTNRQALDGLARIAHWTASRLSHFARVEGTRAKEGTEPSDAELAAASSELRCAASELRSMADTFLSRLAAGKAASDAAVLAEARPAAAQERRRELAKTRRNAPEPDGAA